MSDTTNSRASFEDPKGELLARAERYLEEDIDADDRNELSQWMARTRNGDARAIEELQSRFAGPLQFGTAGIRGLVGAGESRMNRAVIRRVTFGLVQVLLARHRDARERGLVLARDARYRSASFQREAAGVCIAAGIPVFWLEGPEPTPLAAFAIRDFGAVAGVVITASHNPRDYNGYKAYWDNGAQIVPPIDQEIAHQIAAAPPAPELPWQEPRRGVSETALVRDTTGIHDRYLASIPRSERVGSSARSGVRVAYSALHGVGEPLMRRLMTSEGYDFHAVPEQAKPDPSFPTVEFPNPEEPGALDLLLELAREQSADVAIANDPDADRLAAAFWDAENQSFQVLSGNELGVLLADHLLRFHRPEHPLVATTVVSSRLLQKIAEREDVLYLETLTGFKWITTEAIRLEREQGASFLFGFEEALGYAVGTAVRDKDGISAAAVLVELVAECKAQKLSPLDRLTELFKQYGHFVSGQKSFILQGVEGKKEIERAMSKLRATNPARLGNERVASIWDLAEGTLLKPGSGPTQHPDESLAKLRSDVLVLDLEDGGRCAMRPSGTEPKLKIYLEVVEPYSITSRTQAEARISDLAAALGQAAGLEV